MDGKKVQVVLVVVCFVLLVVLAFLIVRPFIAALLAGFIFAYLFYPVYRFVLRYVKLPTLSALLIMVLVIAIIIVPLIFLANLIINEALIVYRSDMPTRIAALASSFFAESSLLGGGITDVIRKTASYVVTVATDFLIGVPSKVLHFVIFIYTMFHMLLVGESSLAKVKSVVPFRNKEKLLQHLGNTTYAIVYGLFLVALIEFVIALIGFTVLQTGAPVLLALLVFLTALLPFIGPSVIFIPFIVFKLVQGEILTMVGLLIVWIILVYVDTIVRTKMISDKAKMHPVVVLLGIIGGIGVFGVVGLVVGPLVLSFLTVIVEDYYHEVVKAE